MGTGALAISRPLGCWRHRPGDANLRRHGATIAEREPVLTPDRVLAGLVLALLGAAALVQPVWRALDPRPAQVLAAREAFQARAEVDPWGTPWRREPPLLPQPDLLAVRSLGPDRADQGGAGDDLWVGLEHDGAPTAGMYQPSPERSTRGYERSWLVLLAFTLALLLTRLYSGWWPPGPRRASRVGAAAALALVPFAKTLVVAQGLGVLEDVTRAAGVIAPPALAAAGSLYALTFALVYVHRELNAAPPGAS